MEKETSWHYDVGIYHRLTKDIDTRLSAYYTDISNYVVVDSAGRYYQANYAYNLSSVSFYGIEWEFNAKLFDKLSLFGNYTYRGTERDETDFPVVFWLNLPPKHKANLGMRCQLLKDTLLTCDLRYVGKRGSEGSLSMDESSTTDLGIEQTIFEKEKFGPAKLLVFVNNLFGEDYQEVYGYPMPHQTYGVQLKLILF